jgi:hypothetical protein
VIPQTIETLTRHLARTPLAGRARAGYAGGVARLPLYMTPTLACIGAAYLPSESRFADMRVRIERYLPDGKAGAVECAAPGDLAVLLYEHARAERSAYERVCAARGARIKCVSVDWYRETVQPGELGRRVRATGVPQLSDFLDAVASALADWFFNEGALVELSGRWYPEGENKKLLEWIES